jgi:hypothetical protein
MRILNLLDQAIKLAENCGTGYGGFVSGNTCAGGEGGGGKSLPLINPNWKSDIKKTLKAEVMKVLKRLPLGMGVATITDGDMSSKAKKINLGAIKNAQDFIKDQNISEADSEDEVLLKGQNIRDKLLSLLESADEGEKEQIKKSIKQIEDIYKNSTE